MIYITECLDCGLLFTGRGEIGLAPRPSRKKVKVCPSCRGKWNVAQYYIGEEEDDPSETRGRDTTWAEVRAPAYV